VYILLRRWVPLALAGLCSCALLHEFRPSWAGPPGPFRVLAENVEYDGEMLQFRILVGAVDVESSSTGGSSRAYTSIRARFVTA